MNDGTLTITEFLASCGHGRGPRFLGPKIDNRDETAKARFEAADEKLLAARLALADAEEELFGRNAGELRGLAIETHHRHRSARRGRRPTP